MKIKLNPQNAHLVVHRINQMLKRKGALVCRSVYPLAQRGVRSGLLKGEKLSSNSSYVMDVITQTIQSYYTDTFQNKCVVNWKVFDSFFTKEKYIIVRVECASHTIVIREGTVIYFTPSEISFIDTDGVTDEWHEISKTSIKPIRVSNALKHKIDMEYRQDQEMSERFMHWDFKEMEREMEREMEEDW